MLQRQSNLHIRNQEACDFPEQKLTKMAMTSLQLTDEAAFAFALNFAVSYGQITSAMVNESFARGAELFDELAAKYEL